MPLPESESPSTEQNESPGAKWRRERTLNAQHLEEELHRRRKRESDQARELLSDFVTRASAAQIPQVLLKARTYNGKSRYKTRVYGWYLKSDESLAVDQQGQFYILSVANSLKSWFSGATITPSDPPLILGLGGRDGESIDLTEAIDRILHPEKYASPR